MRLHRLVFAGLGPFREQQEIDFDALTSSGLFLIDGPTGAGKTTVIDAIVFALYGDVSGKDADDSRLRSDFASPSEPSFVECELSVGDRRVWLRRTPSYQRAKARGTGTTKEAASQLLRELDSDGSVRAELSHASEIGAHIKSLLGMSAEQFRQLVVLPQGEFAELLRMKPGERFAALGPLLGDEFFGRLQEDLDAAASQARSQRSAAADAVRDASRELLGALGPLDRQPLQDEIDALLDESNGDREAAARGILGWLVARATALTQELAAHEQEATLAREQAGLARRYAQARQQLELRMSEREAAHGALDLLDRAVDPEQARARVAELHQGLGRLEPWAGWEQRSSERAETHGAIEHRLRAAEDEALRLTAQLEAIPDERMMLQELVNARSVLASMREQRLKDLQMLEQQLNQAEALARLDSQLQQAQTSAAMARDLADLTAAERQTSARALDEALSTYALERAAALAQSLVHGQPCPVCGALEHPEPSSALHVLVTDAQIAELREQLARCEERAREAEMSAQSAEQQVMELKLSWSRQQGALGGFAEDEHAQALAQAQAALADAESAARQLPDSERRLDQLAARAVTLQQELQAAASSAAEQRTALQHASEQTERESAEFHALVGESGSAQLMTQQMQQRIDRLEDFMSAETAVAAARAALPGLPGPVDVASWIAQVQEADETAQAALRQQRRITGEVMHAARAVAVPVESFCAALLELRRTIDSTAAAITLGDAVSAARSGVNTKRMTLQSYAVQRRFDSVLGAASIHLARMSAGKYSLELDEQARGNAQAGLGIKVRDEWTGQARDPRSLSGGETFYAALALALGLADVVRDEAGGTQLETLFVDEGFGSLDQESLQLVLDQLDLLRSGGRVVGVVSHVTEMKEWVQQRVEVSVGPDRTSRLRTLP